MMGAAELQASHDGTTRAASWWRAWWPEITIVAWRRSCVLASGPSLFWFDEGGEPGLGGGQPPAFIWPIPVPLLNDKHPPAYPTCCCTTGRRLALDGLEHSDVALRSLGAIRAC